MDPQAVAPVAVPARSAVADGPAAPGTPLAARAAGLPVAAAPRVAAARRVAPVPPVVVAPRAVVVRLLRGVP
jgi:hypothetical protein